MNLENVQVVHKSFGEGSVVEHDGSYVEVCFPCGTKRFLFPDAFGTFLKVADPQLAEEVEKLRQKVACTGRRRGATESRRRGKTETTLRERADG